MLRYKIYAFLKRDFIDDISYKFAFVFELFTSVFPLLSFYFIGKLVDESNSESIFKYGGGYFSFAMVGVAFTQYFMLALRTFASTIRRNQQAGCLEAMLSTQTRPQTTIVLSSIYSFFMKTIHIVLAFAIGGLFFGVNYSHFNVFGVLTTLILTIIAFGALGIISAAIIIINKKGEPVEWILGSLCSLLGGAFFPISVMPDWMQKIAMILPITYSLEAMRLAVFKNYSIVMLWKQLLVLGFMAIILLPSGLCFFSFAVDKARRDGTLMHY